MSAISQAPAPEIVEALEKQLTVSLRPVRPNQAFVDHLHTRLSSPPIMVLERRNTALSMLLIAMSLGGGVMLIWLTHRLRNAVNTNPPA